MCRAEHDTVGDASTTGSTEVRLRHSQDDRPGISRRRAGRDSATGTSMVSGSPTTQRSGGSAHWPSHRHGPTCGSAPKQTAISRRRVETRGVASSTDTIPLWLRRQDRHKFDRMVAFARALPRIRRRCDADLSRRGLPRDKVLAAVVRLLELTLIRVGNEEYARLNRSFGLTTLRDRHARIDGARLRSGSAASPANDTTSDSTTVDLPPSSDGARNSPGRTCSSTSTTTAWCVPSDRTTSTTTCAESAGVRSRPRISGPGPGPCSRIGPFSRCQPRTLRVLPDATSAAAMRTTADRLGNSPAVARASYVHPAVIDAYVEGRVGGASRPAQDTDDGASTSVASTIRDERDPRSPRAWLPAHRRRCRGTAEGGRSTRSGRARQGESER